MNCHGHCHGHNYHKSGTNGKFDEEKNIYKYVFFKTKTLF